MFLTDLSDDEKVMFVDEIVLLIYLIFRVLYFVVQTVTCRRLQCSDLVACDVLLTVVI